MSSRCIRITDEAYSRLMALKSGDETFSDVILRFYPKRRKLSEILATIGADKDLADDIERASAEMRGTAKSEK
jgi:predicted CopG family antitoxin